MNKVHILSLEKVSEMEKIVTDLLEELKKELNCLKLREKYEEDVGIENRELLNNFLSNLKEDDYEMIYRRIEYWFEKVQKFVIKSVKEIEIEKETKVIIDEEKEHLRIFIEDLKKRILSLNEKINQNSSDILSLVKERIDKHMNKIKIELEEIIIQKNSNGIVSNNKSNDIIEHFSSINERKTYEILEDYMTFSKTLKERESEIISNYKELDKISQNNELHMKNMKILQTNPKLENILNNAGFS